MSSRAVLIYVYTFMGYIIGPYFYQENIAEMYLMIKINGREKDLLAPNLKHCVASQIWNRMLLGIEDP